MAKSVLFIEDDVPTIDVYGTALKAAGFEVEVISLGQTALERVREIKANKTKRPDVVLLDIILPDINGIEVLKQLKEDPKTKDIPVLIITNYTDQRPERKGIDVEYDRFILKTECPPSKLVAIIKEILEPAV